MEVNEGSLKIELKQVPQYAAIAVLCIAWLNPTFLTDLTTKYLSNVVYFMFISAGLAYVNSFQFFQEMFDVHKNENLHTYEPPTGTQKYHTFDGRTRVVILLHKEMVVREVRREVLLLGNGPQVVEDDGIQVVRGRTQGGGRRRTRETTTTIQDAPNHVDTHVHLRIVVSKVEPDKKHWSYWLSYLGYETKKIEIVQKDDTCIL